MSPGNTPRGTNKLDGRTFRAALGTYTTGVAIVTAKGVHGRPVGLTVNSFSSVSLEPPLVLWCLAKKALSLRSFECVPYWIVNVLSADQTQLATRFAKAGEDKFAGLRLDYGLGGAPLLPGCCARFQCRNAFRYEGGDHVVLVGEVECFDHVDRLPLVFQGGQFVSIESNSLRTTFGGRKLSYVSTNYGWDGSWYM